MAEGPGQIMMPGPRPRSGLAQWIPPVPAATDATLPAALPQNLVVVRRWLVVALFASIFLQRFAVPLGTTGIPINLFVTLGALAMLGLHGALTVDPRRTAMLCTFAAYASFSAVLNPESASPTSFVFLLAIYAPFALELRAGDAVFRSCLQAFQSMVLVGAVCGIIQFLAQSVIAWRGLFTFIGVLPDQILLHGADNLQPLSYGMRLYKSNGFFFIEPSTYSQYLAVAIIVELLFFNNIRRLLVFGPALLFSFSGTGFIALAVVVPFVLIQRRAYGLAFGILLFAVLATSTGHLWHMDASAQRVGEFGGTDSSAHARFIAPTVLLARFLTTSRDLLLGIGPGSIAEYVRQMPYETHDPTWAKLLFEYGIIGSVLFWWMFLVAVFDKAPSGWLCVALTIGFLTFGGMLLDPRIQVLLLVFCVLPKRIPAPLWPQLRATQPSAAPS